MAHWNEVKAGMTIEVTDINGTHTVYVSAIKIDKMFGTVRIWNEKGETVALQVRDFMLSNSVEIKEPETASEDSESDESFAEWVARISAPVKLTGLEMYEIRQRSLITAYSPYFKIAQLQEQTSPSGAR